MRMESAGWTLRAVRVMTTERVQGKKEGREGGIVRSHALGNLHLLFRKANILHIIVRFQSDHGTSKPTHPKCQLQTPLKDTIATNASAQTPILTS